MLRSMVSLLCKWLPAVLCLQAFPLPFSMESRELLLLHIFTAKASCSTANPHCPLIRKLEMEENKQKVKDKKQKQSKNINKKGKIRRGFYGTSCRLAGADAPSITYLINRPHLYFVCLNVIKRSFQWNLGRMIDVVIMAV